MEHETSALLKAVRSGNLSRFQNLFKSMVEKVGMDKVLSVSTDFGNLLWTAIVHGSIRIVSFLADFAGELELANAVLFAYNINPSVVPVLKIAFEART